MNMIEHILQECKQLQSWELKELVERIQRGGNLTVYGRYRFNTNAYPFLRPIFYYREDSVL